MSVAGGDRNSLEVLMRLATPMIRVQIPAAAPKFQIAFSKRNRFFNDYSRISRFGHLYSPSRRSAYISALYLKSSDKNHGLELDLQKIRALEAQEKIFIKFKHAGNKYPTF
ncbi:hypothetical protein DRO64_03830 [Candidatus Bathyarchaeota archaeon]|nr:MAG: hypothetical protein DRO64_03830 [Candidatus Bathyarchaeota archaeon]